MAVWRVVIHRRIRRWLKRHQLYEAEFMEAVERLGRDPYIGERLRGRCSGFYKLRLGELRIMYLIDPRENIVYIEAVGLRENFYEKYC